VLGFLLDQARSRAGARVLLETGSEDYFAPARRLYERHGFAVRGPFADYTDDPNSVYMELAL
jgi:putative acetyltransferase